MAALWLGYFAGACAAALAIASWRPIWAWRLRKLPGPMRLPLVGNLVSIMANGNMVLWLQEMSKRYGTVFQIWNGSHPMVVITDPELVRKMLTGNTGRPGFEFFTCLTGIEHDMMHSGLLSLSPEKHGAKFRFLRKAFEQTVLSPSALAAHAVMLSECASRLVTYLSRYAASGEPVDMTVPLADMAMDAIGFAAFGLDLDCLSQAGTDVSDATAAKGSRKNASWADAPPGSPQFSKGLVEAARMIFKHSDVSQGSAWLIPGLLLPSIGDLIRHVANVFPDSLLRTEVTARRGMHKALQALIVEWRRHKAAEPSAASTGTFSATSDRGFLGNMLGSMGSEQGVRELDVMAQCLTMILAGYETTSSSISATLHLLAQHPEAQARLQRELDDVLKGKLATAEDLERLPYLCAALDEALRIYPTADGAFRLLTPRDRDVDLGDGRVIPGGSFLWLDFHTFHNDPAIWPRATEFLPERFIQPGNEALAPSNPHAYLPFGIGSRMCPGYKFGLMEGRLTLARLFQAYTFTPAPNCPLPVWKSGIVYTADHVWLTIKPRQK